MSDEILCLFFILAAYLLGSIPFGLIAGFKAKGLDIREFGSKNIGATNVFRVIGKKWGITVLLLDALKGYIACAFPIFFIIHFGQAFYSDMHTYCAPIQPMFFFSYTGYNSAVPFQLLLGISAIFGHSFPVWLKFKGGKGVATSLGVFLAIAWIPTLITFGIWGICFALTHIISLSSLLAAVVFPVMITWCYAGTTDLKFLLPISITLTVFILYTHRANIQRLRQRTEKKLF